VPARHGAYVLAALQLLLVVLVFGCLEGYDEIHRSATALRLRIATTITAMAIVLATVVTSKANF
jgi:hypothetical protein